MNLKFMKIKMTIEEFKRSDDYLPSPELDSYKDVIIGPRVIDMQSCRWSRPVLQSIDGHLMKIGCVPCKGQDAI